MIWILWHRRIGDLHQMQELAKALDLPIVVKKLQFRKPHYAPLAGLTLDLKKSDPLLAPWPDLVICAEALTSIVAKKLRKQSAGKIKTVALVRPSGDTKDFDLVLTTAQYRLPGARNIVELGLPLTSTKINSPTQLRKLPTITVLIGATSPPELLDEVAVLRLVDELKAYADQKQSILNFVTSPRTSPQVVAEISRSINSPHQTHIWQKNAENPYRQLMAEAGEIIVTSDSVSMLADGLAAGKSVQVYRLPRHLSVMQRLVERLYLMSPKNWIFQSGLIEPTTDRWLLIQRLVQDEHVSWFGTTPKPLKPYDRDTDLNTAVAAVRKLLES
jgi:mitochondrial fission protein ELM1